MTHYIIDHKKRQEYLIIFLAFIAISFGLGYTIGYLHGTPANADKTVKVEPLTSETALPAPATKIEDKVEHVPSENNAATTATPEVVANKKKSAPAATAAKTKTESTAKIEVASNQKSNSPLPTKIEQSEEGKPATEEDSQFLVQVALFSSRDNASSFVAQLKEEDFNAFIDAFISSSGDEKYNVRLGPFSAKGVAESEMASFQELHDTPAYILNRK